MSDDARHSKNIAGPHDPHVERFRPRPDEPPQPRASLIGFLGDSDGPGHRRLYFSTSLDYYVEFKIDDVLTAASIPPERAPFPGMEATEVTLRNDAVLSYTRTRRARPPDEFDIDLRRAPRRMPRPRYRRAAQPRAGTDRATCGEECGSEQGTCGTCETCETCAGETCVNTFCDQETCRGDTCETACVGCPTSHPTCFPVCQDTLGCPVPSVIETACNTCPVHTQCQPFCH